MPLKRLFYAFFILTVTKEENFVQAIKQKCKIIKPDSTHILHVKPIKPLQIEGF